MSLSVQLIGLGRMGLGVGARLARVTSVFGYDPDPSSRTRAKEKKIEPCDTLHALQMTSPKGNHCYWIMVPAGDTVDKVIRELEPRLFTGDIVIEGGNSHYKDSLRRASRLSERGVEYLDVGVSGGVHGEKEGFCLMVGGTARAMEKALPLFQAVAVDGGLAHVGPTGAGHYVKMIHNAIEYGMLQVMGEGFSLLKGSDFSLDLGKVASVWSHGSVIRGWLMDLTRDVLKNQDVSRLSDEVGGGETGRWAAQEALLRKIPAPLIIQSLMERYASTQEENFGHQLISGLRNAFGGHESKAK